MKKEDLLTKNKLTMDDHTDNLINFLNKLNLNLIKYSFKIC
ncbi:hypothetical protein [Clostridium muellerianum]|nr:hypothetical protein [Clostridium muellerianum]